MEDAENHLRLAGRGQHQALSKSFFETSGPMLFVFSSQDEKGISRVEATYNQYLNANKHLIGPNYSSRLAYTLSERRSALLWRSFAICSSLKDLAKGIKLSKPVRALTSPRLAFCFTGQGAQWAAMGRELNIFELYKQSVTESSAVLKLLGCPWTVEGKLSGSVQLNNAKLSNHITR